MLVSGVQEGDPVHLFFFFLFFFFFFFILSPYILVQNIEYGSLCYIVDPC